MISTLFTASYSSSLPVTVTVTPTNMPVAGRRFTLMCDHGSTASTPTYQWFDNTGAMAGTASTLTLNPLLESHTGEYSCLITDQSDGLVGCGVHRVTVQGTHWVCVHVCVFTCKYHVSISDLHVAPSVTVSVEGVDGATAGTEQTLTCSVSGVDLAAAEVTSVMYTWLHDGSMVPQAASTSNQYTISTGSLNVNNAGDVYTCQAAITTSYWDVSESFGGSGSGTLTVISKSKWLPNIFMQ